MADKEYSRLEELNPLRFVTSVDQLSGLILGEEVKPKVIGQKGDPELKYLTEGNIPISEAEMETRRIRKKWGDAAEEVKDVFWDAVKGGSQSAYDLYKYGPKGPSMEVKKERAIKAQKELEEIRLKESEELLNEEKLKKLTNDRANDLIEKLEYSATSDGDWTVEMAHNACEFVRNFSGEMQVSFFNKIMDCGHLDLVMKVHKIIGSEIVDLVNSSDAYFQKN